jgi:hypothetical protein
MHKILFLNLFLSSKATLMKTVKGITLMALARQFRRIRPLGSKNSSVGRKHWSAGPG